MPLSRLTALLLPCALLLAGCRDTEGVEHSTPKLNVVVVSIDTLRADHLSVYGYERPTSPNIDALAARGVLFEQAFSQSPVTAPAHMTIFTGLLPASHGVWNLETEGSHALPEGIPTLASILQQRGMRTFAVTAGGNVNPRLGFDRGFEAYEVPGEAYAGGAREIFRRARERVDELQDERFFLFVHTYQTHDPYTPPPGFRERFCDPGYSGRILSDFNALKAEAGPDWSDWHRVYWERVDKDSPEDVQHLRDLYDACIAHTDEELGGFLAHLDELGLTDETVVIVLSDHGEEFGEHGGFMHYAVYQECLHVPLILSAPGLERPAGTRVRERVRLLDVLPTVLDLLDIEPPDSVQGRSLLREIPPDLPVLSHWPREHLYALRTADLKLIRAETGPEARLYQEPRTELYDLGSDPGERSDLAAERPAEVQALAQLLASTLELARELLKGREPGQDVELSPEELARLRALGYGGDD